MIACYDRLYFAVQVDHACYVVLKEPVERVMAHSLTCETAHWLIHQSIKFLQR